MMETIRTLIIAGLVFVGFLLWQSWQEKTAQEQLAERQSLQSAESTRYEAGTSPASNGLPAAPDLPMIDEVAQAQEETQGQYKERWVTVKTDVMMTSIDTLGGNIVHLSLLDYPKSLENHDPLVLLDNAPDYLYIAESGLVADKGPDIPGIPNVREQKIAQYSTAQKEYVLKDGEDVLNVVLTWKNSQGLAVKKQFTFHRGEYVVDLDYQINNNMREKWLGSLFLQFKRNDHLPGETNIFAFPSYFGAAISSPDKRYEKIPLDELNEDVGLSPGRTITEGWFAMVQHYFVSAWIPDPSTSYLYSGGLYKGDTYFLRAVGQPFEINAGQKGEVSARFYAGPKITQVLSGVAPKLELTVDYGWLWPVSQALFWLMKQIYEVIGNWGWAIILVTVLIKLVFYKLSATSYRSMANMRRLQPKFTALKERYGDDRQKMSQELMALYKKEKINPLGGCLPILVQIPVFIALYWVLIESVEFRLAPFMFWIQDLSAKDPYYILPLLMGATMFIQQRLSPQPPDPLQAKVMMFMPVVFTIVFLNFPAGLVLYWLVNNVLSIAQQWSITRKIERDAAARE